MKFIIYLMFSHVCICVIHLGIPAPSHPCYKSAIALVLTYVLYCKHKTRGVSTRKDYFSPCINWRFSISHY